MSSCVLGRCARNPGDDHCNLKMSGLGVSENVSVPHGVAAGVIRVGAGKDCRNVRSDDGVSVTSDDD